MDLIKQIFDSGVVGCGGAGFPTHVKLKASPEILIINGAECEPLLRTDRYLMIHEAEKLVSGVDLICRELSIPEGRIALKKTYTKEIEALTAAIEKLHSKVQLHLMDSFYPAGDEQVVVYEVTGKVVPPAGIPLDVGAIVDNVATIIAVADAVSGIPFTEKYLTVTGENCSMWDFKDQLEYEAVEEAAIKPVQLTKYYTETKTGDIPNLDCFGWWTTHSDGIEVTEKPVCITFDTISYQQAKENWHTPLIVVFSAFDKLVNGVLYDEYAVIRSDAYAWNAGAGALETETAFESKWTSWDQWLQDNKNGVKASVTAVRQENTILITLENDGVTIETQVQIPMEKNLPVCLSLSGELCYISNIRIK